MQRLLDHFCFPAELLGVSRNDTPLAAELSESRPLLQTGSFQGQPLWYHTPSVDSNALLRTDDDQPFDADDAIACIQFEHYVQLDPPDREKGLRSLYYRLKPVMPRRLQLEMQRLNARKRLRSAPFPSWPQDNTLSDLLAAFLVELMQRAGVEKIPFLGFWPKGHTWACSLTHDVDTGFGYQNMHLLAEIEQERGRTSAWFIVPERYEWDSGVLESLRQKGHEVGVHGVDHSGKLFESRAEFEWRRDRINRYAYEWKARGFRSPATYRNPYWLTEIEVAYDSSFMDIATLEPQRGGVCAPFPFLLNDNLVELPITLPMDHTLINILKQDVFETCRDKVNWIRAQHGLALALFHPDYNTQPAELASYARLIEHLAADSDVWFALPDTIADWWQRRRRSRVVQTPGGAMIEGPAAEDGAIWWAHLEGAHLRIQPGDSPAGAASG